METFWKDFRYNLRTLRRNPGLTILSLVSLALGIGATSAIFSVVNAVLLRPLAYPESERLVMVWENHFKSGRDRNRVAPNNYLDWKENNRVFEEIAAILALDEKNLSGAGDPIQVKCHRVTANFFPLLGARAVLGRAFLPQDDIPNSNLQKEEPPEGQRVVILSYGIWQQRFGGDPGVIERTVQIDRQSYTVIGVMPPDFQFLNQPADLWIPIGLDPAKDYRAIFGRFLWVLARLRPGVTLQQAQEEMNSISSQTQAQNPIFNAGWGVNLVPLEKQAVGEIRQTLLVLFGAVGFVLLIACANVANMRLAQATGRLKELALRAALGASRLRIIRQLLIENLTQAVIGGFFGLALAFWLTKLLVALAPANIPRLTEINLDFRVLSFTLLVSLLAGTISGLAPAWQASMLDLNQTIKEAGRGATAGGSGKRLRELFVVLEFALAIVLLIGAGLMIKSFIRLQKVDPEINPERLLTLQILLPQPAYLEFKKRISFFEQAIRGIETIPGVKSASAVSNLPFGGPRLTAFFMIEGRHLPNAIDKPRADIRAVSHNYLRTMGIPLLRGRDFTEREITGDDAKVVIISETMAQQFWPNENPLGRKIRINRPENAPDEIIGVAANVKNLDLESSDFPTVYWPHQRWPFPSGSIVVRTTIDPLNLSAAVISQIRSLDPNQSVAAVRTLDQVLYASMARQRFNTFLLTTFAIFALLLATLGIYGVMSYVVTQRTHEIGIRIALGAQRSDVLNLVIRQGMGLTLSGVGIGLLAAFALTRFMKSLLLNVETTDPATYLIIALLLASVALLACCLPARRASRSDPMEILRHE